MGFRVTSLERLSLAEFIGRQARPKVYQNGHKKSSRPLVHFSNEGQKWPKSDFQSQFFMSKIIRIFLNFFSFKNMNLGEHFLLLKVFHNFEFWINLFSKMMPNFWPLLLKWTKGLELFYGQIHRPLAFLIHLGLSYALLFNWVHANNHHTIF